MKLIMAIVIFEINITDSDHLTDNRFPFILIYIIHCYIEIF
jgi:hypothetical protein